MRNALLTLTLMLFGLLFSPESSAQSYSTEKIIVPPSIDGRIEIDEYPGQALLLQSQMEPERGAEATVRTEFHLTYDDNFLYAAFHCRQDSTAALVANVRTRDALEKSDDAVFLLLDPYHDRRSGYVFLLNALGTQTDIRLRDDGRSTDIRWDAEWLCRTSSGNGWWSAELRIPFEAIKHRDDGGSWGANAGRVYRHNSEVSTLAGPLIYDYQVSRALEVTGITPSLRTPWLFVTPYATVWGERYRGREWDTEYDAGADFDVRLSSSLTASATINPDFATVEGDEEQINLTRYELFYPEKRPFFIDGNDLYDTRIRQFYSRRIGDIDAGAKVVGKMGPVSASLLAVHTPERSFEEGVAQEQTWSTAARFSMDVLKSSAIGNTITDRRTSDGALQSSGVDYFLNLADTWKLTGQAVGTAPGALDEQYGFFMRFANESSVHHVHLRYTQLGREFMEKLNQLGYITDDDRRELDSDLEYKWWFDSGVLQYIDAEVRNNVFWSLDGELRGYHVKQDLRFYSRSGISLDFLHTNEYRLFERGFDNHSTRVVLGYNTDEWASVASAVEAGKNFDRDYTLYDAMLQVEPLERLTFTYTLRKLDYHGEAEEFSTVINRAALNYHLTPDLWLRLVGQNHSADDRIYVYSMLGWRVLPPFSALYLVYSFEEDPVVPELPAAHRLFLKASYRLGW